MRMMNPRLQTIVNTVNSESSALSTLYIQSLRILYTGLKPANYFNTWLENIDIDYAIFPVIFRYFTTTDNNTVNILLQNYGDSCQKLIGYIVDQGVETPLEQKISEIKKSMVSLNEIASTLLAQDEALSYVYKVPYEMSLRQVMHNNNKNFNDASDISLIFTLNKSKISIADNIPKGTELTILKNGALT